MQPVEITEVKHRSEVKVCLHFLLHDPLFVVPNEISLERFWKFCPPRGSIVCCTNILLCLFMIWVRCNHHYNSRPPLLSRLNQQYNETTSLTFACSSQGPLYQPESVDLDLRRPPSTLRGGRTVPPCMQTPLFKVNTCLSKNTLTMMGWWWLW